MIAFGDCHREGCCMATWVPKFEFISPALTYRLSLDLYRLIIIRTNIKGLRTLQTGVGLVLIIIGRLVDKHKMSIHAEDLMYINAYLLLCPSDVRQVIDPRDCS